MSLFFCPTFNLEYVSHDIGYYFSFINFITWIFYQGCYRTSPLVEHRPWYSMTPTTNKTTEKQNILPMELYNLAPCSIYNEQHAESNPK